MFGAAVSQVSAGHAPGGNFRKVSHVASPPSALTQPSAMKPMGSPFFRSVQSDLASLLAGRCRLRPTPAELRWLAPPLCWPKGQIAKVTGNSGPFPELAHVDRSCTDGATKYFPQGKHPPLSPTL